MSLYSYRLLAEKYHDQILKTIESNRTIIIKGPTGCGKSTYIPFILKDKKVAIVEPRRIAVMALYTILSQKIQKLGYKMRFNQNMPEDASMVIYTDGSFLNSISSLEYDYIIIDEVHERSLRTDLILSIFKANCRSKLILMSATLDTTKLERFFNAVTFNIPGEGHPLDVKYLEAPTSDYITETYLTVKKILKSKDREEKKDILVFLPGEEDISEAAKLLQKIPSVSIFKVHSTMGDKEQRRIYDKSDLIRVILSTNICETSLTIPNIKYVIDSGLCKVKVFDQISYFGVQPITLESAIQRMGRCNRLGPGVCYKLYTSSQKLLKFSAEIARSDLTTFVLYLISLKKNIFSFEFVDYPPVENMLSALEFLIDKKCILLFYENQVLDSLDKKFENTIDFIDIATVSKNVSYKITNYGRKIIHDPFDVHLSHFYEQCITGGVGYYGSILVSLISQENFNFLNSEVEKKSDIEMLVSIFEKYQEKDDKLGFCLKANVPIKGMEIATKIFKTLNKSKNESREADLETTEWIFSRCFEHNMCSRNSDGSYFLHRINRNVYVHPTSGFFKRRDKRIVLVDIFSSSKAYGKIVGKYYS